MATNWTSERREQQRQAIRRWRPWEKSTGPRSEPGKRAASRNSWKGGNRVVLRTLAHITPTAAPGGLEEILVTSQRREERLEDVPMSVSAFAQEKMDAQGIRSVDDLTASTPSVNFERMGLSAASNYNQACAGRISMCRCTARI